MKLGAYSKISTARAMGWLENAWRLYKRQPLVWSASIILVCFLSVAFMQVPVAGQVLNLLIQPFFILGVIVAVKASMKEESIGINHFVEPLTVSNLKRILGVVLFQAIGGFLLMAAGIVVLGLFLGFAALASIAEKREFANPIFVFLFMSIIFLFLIPMLLTAYAIPLAAFKNLKTLDAIELSFQAMSKNAWPLTWSGLYCITAVFIGTVFTCFLGFFVMSPLIQIVFALSYFEIFPEEPKNLNERPVSGSNSQDEGEPHRNHQID